MNLKTALPELNENQHKLLDRYIEQERLKTELGTMRMAYNSLRDNRECLTCYNNNCLFKNRINDLEAKLVKVMS